MIEFGRATRGNVYILQLMVALYPFHYMVPEANGFAAETCRWHSQGAKMGAGRQIPLDLTAHLRQEPDNSYTIVVEIFGIPSLQIVNRVSKRLRTVIRENADILVQLGRPPGLALTINAGRSGQAIRARRRFVPRKSSQHRGRGDHFSR
jgi:hypothetical protein